MAELTCPLPQVQEALEPFIHTRQETRRIREAIAQHLSAPIDSSLYLPLQLSCPTPEATVGEPLDGLDGLYKRYYEALRANMAARESYAAVKRELDEARVHSATSTSRRTHIENRNGARSAVYKHLDLQRQRRQHNKLQIVQETLDKLTEHAPRTVHRDLGTVLKESLGSAPEAPKSAFSPGASDAQLEGLVFRLKRELLVTMKSMEEWKDTGNDLHEHSKARLEPTVEAQVYALRQARDQLISWIEGELAKIGEGDSSIMESETDSHDAADLPPPEDIKEQIQSLYDKYVESRGRLVQSVDAALATVDEQPSTERQLSDPVPTQKGQQISKGPALKYSDLITCVPTLVHASRTERSLIQQTSYLRRQLAEAAEDMGVTIQRLAGESYLVPPDATNMGAWAKAAAAKGEETDAFVRDQLTAGKQCVDMIGEGLSKAEAKRAAMEQLKGDL